MADKDDIGRILTALVTTYVVLSVVPVGIRAALYPSTENLSEAITAAAVNWWVPLAEAPLILLGVLLLFTWSGAKEALEL